MWEIVAGEMQSWGAVGSFSAVPIVEAPPEMLTMLRRAQADADANLKEKGPFKAPIAAVRYGALPSGYREEVPARVLGPGAYHLLLFSEQGQISKAFDVPAA